MLTYGTALLHCIAVLTGAHTGLKHGTRLLSAHAALNRCTEVTMRLALISTKGGTGKTTSAVYLATALHRIGRTLLVDADPQLSALTWSQQGDGLPFTVISLPVRDLHKRVADLGDGFERRHLPGRECLRLRKCLERRQRRQRDKAGHALQNGAAFHDAADYNAERMPSALCVLP